MKKRLYASLLALSLSFGTTSFVDAAPKQADTTTIVTTLAQNAPAPLKTGTWKSNNHLASFVEAKEIFAYTNELMGYSRFDKQFTEADKAVVLKELNRYFTPSFANEVFGWYWQKQKNTYSFKETEGKFKAPHIQTINKLTKAKDSLTVVGSYLDGLEANAPKVQLTVTITFDTKTNKISAVK